MTKKQKTIMEEFEIDELSGVDFPAMEGAKAVLFKRHDPADVEKFDLGFQNPRATNSVNGAQHLLDDNGLSGTTTWETSDGEEQSHSHSWIRNNDGEITVLMSEGHDHQLIAKRADASTKKPATGGGHDNPDKESIMDEDTKKAVAESNAVIQEQLDAEKSRADRAEKMAELTDAQKEHLNGLPKSDQESFLSLDKDGRQNEVEKATAEDPVIYKDLDGNEYRESDDKRVVSAVKRADSAEKRSRASDERVEKADLAKRASELKFIKGEDEVKIALLKAIDGIKDEDLREGALEIVASMNSGLKQAFEKRGTAFGDDTETDAEAQYEKLSQEYAKAHSCTIETARADVLMVPENAELAIELTQRQPVID